MSMLMLSTVMATPELTIYSTTPLAVVIWNMLHNQQTEAVTPRTVSGGTEITWDGYITLSCPTCANNLVDRIVDWTCTFYNPSGIPYDQVTVPITNYNCGQSAYGACRWTVPSSALAGNWRVEVKATSHNNPYCVLGTVSDIFTVVGACVPQCTIGQRSCEGVSTEQYKQCESINGCASWVAHYCETSNPPFYKHCQGAGICEQDAIVTTTTQRGATTTTLANKIGWGEVCDYDTTLTYNPCDSGLTCNADDRCCNISPAEVWSSTQNKCIPLNEEQLVTFACEGWKKKGANIFDYFKGTLDCGTQQCDIGTNYYNCCNQECQSPPNECTTNDDCIKIQQGDTCFTVLNSNNQRAGGVCYVASQGTPDTRGGEAGEETGTCPDKMIKCTEGDMKDKCGYPNGIQITSSEATETSKCCSLSYYQRGTKYYCAEYGVIPLEALQCETAWNQLENTVCQSFLTRVVNVFSFGAMDKACENALANYWDCKYKRCTAEFSICKQSASDLSCYIDKLTCDFNTYKDKLQIEIGTIGLLIVIVVGFIVLMFGFGAVQGAKRNVVK